MSNSSTSTAPTNEISRAGSRKSSSTTGLCRVSLNLLISYIENVLSAIPNQGLDCTIIHSGADLRDLVQPVASDFSKLFECISEGAKMFSDQKFLKSRLSTEAHSMAVDVLKGLGNAHWVAVGLLAIANVLERFDNISANDRECIDLLKAMLKLGKYLKQMKDLNVKLDKEILDDMCEAVQLIVSGAILCRSFITSNKLSKFLLTKKIREELVYVRGKVNAMKADLMGHMQLLIMKTLTFIHEQYITGRNEENNCLGITEQYQSKDTEGEMEQTCKTQRDGSESNIVSTQGRDNCNEINGYKQPEMQLRTSFQLGKFLRKIIPTIFRWRRQDSTYLHVQMFVKNIQLPLIEFKRKELKKATKGFTQEIGAGGSSTVYGGILSDGRRVAVKMLKLESNANIRVWVTEMMTLARLQHRNIVELVGYSSEDYMLVYEYMPRNLDSVIYGKDGMIIDWSTRHNIILDILRGLTYLQEGADVCMTHRDIKPSNILLDENLSAKICDFGIARILQRGYAHKEIFTDGVFLEYTNNFSSDTTRIAGTLGYVDPECLLNGRYTLKSDIYSFGMLLLNIVSGKQAYGSTKDKMYVLGDEALRLHEQDRLIELIDPLLLNKDGLINSSRILRTIKIALCCTHPRSERRPSASRVLKMLSSEEEISVPTPAFQSSYHHFSKDDISTCNSSRTFSIFESSIADDHSSEQEIPIPISPVESYVAGDNCLEDKFLSPTLPLEVSSAEYNFSLEKVWISFVADDHHSEEKFLSPTLPLELSNVDYNFSQEENWISFVADDHYSEEKIPTLTPPLELSSADYNFLPEENWIPTPPIKSFVADEHYLEEKIPTPTPPLESLVIQDHSLEEEISIASPPVKSVVANNNSLVKKIEESDGKWPGASLKTLRILIFFTFVSLICLFRMFTNVSPL